MKQATLKFIQKIEQCPGILKGQLEASYKHNQDNKL
jgi:hypothetical protein